MLDRVARLPGAPCLFARGARLGGIAFYHVNGSCRAIPACRDEINHEDTAARGDLFRSYHLPELSAKLNDNQSEEINVIDESQEENRPVSGQKVEIRGKFPWSVLFVKKLLSGRLKDSPRSPLTAPVR